MVHMVSKFASLTSLAVPPVCAIAAFDFFARSAFGNTLSSRQICVRLQRKWYVAQHTRLVSIPKFARRACSYTPTAYGISKHWRHSNGLLVACEIYIRCLAETVYAIMVGLVESIYD